MYGMIHSPVGFMMWQQVHVLHVYMHACIHTAVVYEVDIVLCESVSKRTIVYTSWSLINKRDWPSIVVINKRDWPSVYPH